MTRPGYAAVAAVLLAIEAAIARWVDDRFVRPYFGDCLAVVLVYAALRASTGLRWPVAVAAALAIAVAIELGQLIGILRVLGLDGVPVARVVLGSGFDLGDFVAYASGAALVAGFERRRPARSLAAAQRRA